MGGLVWRVETSIKHGDNLDDSLCLLALFAGNQGVLSGVVLFSKSALQNKKVQAT